MLCHAVVESQACVACLLEYLAAALMQPILDVHAWQPMLLLCWMLPELGNMNHGVGVGRWYVGVRPVMGCTYIRIAHCAFNVSVASCLQMRWSRTSLRRLPPSCLALPQMPTCSTAARKASACLLSQWPSPIPAPGTSSSLVCYTGPHSANAYRHRIAPILERDPQVL